MVPYSEKFKLRKMHTLFNAQYSESELIELNLVLNFKTQQKKIYEEPTLNTKYLKPTVAYVSLPISHLCDFLHTRTVCQVPVNYILRPIEQDFIHFQRSPFENCLLHAETMHAFSTLKTRIRSSSLQKKFFFN